MGVAKHFAAIGAHVGKVAVGEAFDFRDKATVAQALVDAGLGVSDEIRKQHGNHPSAAVTWTGRLILPEPIRYWHDRAAAQHKMLQRSNAQAAWLVNKLCAN
jgi:hypothetical protein